MVYGKSMKEFYDYEKETTNNRMELTAVIMGLRKIKREGVPIEIFTDSMYVRDGVQLWLDKWKRNGWKTANRKPVKNRDLWEILDKLCKRLQPSLNWVPGHSGHRFNERADALANAAARRMITQN